MYIARGVHTAHQASCIADGAPTVTYVKPVGTGTATKYRSAAMQLYYPLAVRRCRWTLQCFVRFVYL